jgi:hypothetical protein
MLESEIGVMYDKVITEYGSQNKTIVKPSAAGEFIYL